MFFVCHPKVPVTFIPLVAVAVLPQVLVSLPHGLPPHVPGSKSGSSSCAKLTGNTTFALTVSQRTRISRILHLGSLCSGCILAMLSWFKRCWLYARRFTFNASQDPVAAALRQSRDNACFISHAVPPRVWSLARNISEQRQNPQTGKTSLGACACSDDGVWKSLKGI